MPKYLISWQEIDSLSIVIDAPSKMVALDKFYTREYDSEDVQENSITFDDESLEVEEL
jgi:hypothetical protein